MTDPHAPLEIGIPTFAKPGWTPPEPSAPPPPGPPASGPPASGPPPLPIRDNPWAVPPRGVRADYPVPEAMSRPLTGLAVATQVMLGLQLLATLWSLIPVLHQHSLIGRLRSDPTSVTVAEAERVDNTVTALAATVFVLYLVTGIVWIIWFHRARTNVQAWSPAVQRLGPGWAIGGWLCPVVNLWFPYMITRDILDGTQGRESDLRVARPSRPLLMTWWLAYVAVFVVSLVERGDPNPHTLDDLTTVANIELVSVVVRLVAGVFAVLVVRQVTAAQKRRRSEARA
jgi:hypothetical protein